MTDTLNETDTINETATCEHCGAEVTIHVTAELLRYTKDARQQWPRHECDGGITYAGFCHWLMWAVL